MKCDCRFAGQNVCGKPLIANIIKSFKMSTGFGYVPDSVAPLANVILSHHLQFNWSEFLGFPLLLQHTHCSRDRNTLNHNVYDRTYIIHACIEDTSNASLQTIFLRAFYEYSICTKIYVYSWKIAISLIIQNSLWSLNNRTICILTTKQFKFDVFLHTYRERGFKRGDGEAEPWYHQDQI